MIVGEDGIVTTGEAGASVDATLTQSGKAADAKSTGDKVSQLHESITNTKEDLEDLESVLTLIKSRNILDRSKCETTSVYGTTVLASEYIDVNAGDTFYYSGHKNTPTLVSLDFWGIRGKKADGSTTVLGNWLQGYSIPEGYTQVQFLFAQMDYQYMLVEKGTQTRVWEEYFKPYYECVDKKAREEIADIENKLVSNESFIVPSAFYGVVGDETNIYYQNIIQHCSMNTVCGCDITGAIAKTERFRDRLIWKPSKSEKKTETINLMKSDWSNIFTSVDIPFVSAPVDTGNKEIKVLVIGDSKIAYGQVIRHLYSFFENDNHTLTLLGTRYDNNNTGDSKYKHEGRSGWSSYHYAFSSSNSGISNPFYNASYTDSQYATHFDFSNYMSKNGYSSVDYVFLLLGTNDFGQNLGDVTWQTDAMIKSIRAYSPSVKIVIGLNEPILHEKLEWLTRNEWFSHLNIKKIDKYDKKTSNVYVLPIYPHIDTVNDYDNPVVEVPLSKADEVLGTGKTRNYHPDGVHESNVGFYKFAHSIYAFIKCVESGLV